MQLDESTQQYSLRVSNAVDNEPISIKFALQTDHGLECGESVTPFSRVLNSQLCIFIAECGEGRSVHGSLNTTDGSNIRPICSFRGKNGWLICHPTDPQLARSAGTISQLRQ